MSKSYAQNHRRTDTNSTKDVRHTSDDALEDREFQLLVEATYELDDYYSEEARLIVLVLGRLGLRVGELCHMKEDWIDWRRRMIEIPAHEPCRRGRDGGICGHCRQLAKQKVEHNDDVTMEEAAARSWEPKTSSAVRSVPFDFHPRVEIAIERYFDRFDEFQTSHTGVHRRLDKAVAKIDEFEDDKNIYPHALRGTAASFHSARGLGAIALQSLFGWATLQTSHRYVRRSGERTQRALNAVHSR